MKEKLVIYGNGSIAKMMYGYLRQSFEIEGFCVDDELLDDDSLNNKILGKPLVAFSEVDKIFPPSAHKMIVAVGYAQMNNVRRLKIEQANQKGFGLINYIHPSVFINDEIIFGENVIVLEYATIHSFTKINDGCFISSNANVGHDCILETCCWLNAGASIGGGSVLGEGSFFGVNASIGHDVKLGKKNFVGANTFVGRSTQDDEVYISSQGEKVSMTSETFLKFNRM